MLDIIADEKLCERANTIGAQMVQRLEAIRRSNASVPIGDIRGLGAMVAFELVTERGGHTPAPDAIKPLTSAALDQGLILLSCGYYANTIRLIPPLTIAEDHLTQGLDILESSLGRAA